VSGMKRYDPSAMKTARPFHFQSSAAAACNSSAVRRASVRRAPVGRRPRALQSLTELGEQVGGRAPSATALCDGLIRYQW
jgi:hypothetical protein